MGGDGGGGARGGVAGEGVAGGGDGGAKLPAFQVVEEDSRVAESVEPILNGLICLVCVFGFLYTAGVFQTYAEDAGKKHTTTGATVPQAGGFGPGADDMGTYDYAYNGRIDVPPLSMDGESTLKDRVSGGDFPSQFTIFCESCNFCHGYKHFISLASDDPCFRTYTPR